MDRRRALWRNALRLAAALLVALLLQLALAGDARAEKARAWVSVINASHDGPGNRSRGAKHRGPHPPSQPGVTDGRG